MKRLFNLLSQRGFLPLMVLFCLLSSSGQAWAFHGGTHNAKITAYTNGNGKVYLTAGTMPSGASKDNKTNTGAESGTTSGNTSILQFNCDGSNDSSHGDCKATAGAKPNAGYYLKGWYSDESRTEKTTATQTTTIPNGDTKIYANFAQITFNANPSEQTIYTTPDAIVEDQEVIFEARYANSLSDFGNPTFILNPSDKWSLRSTTFNESPKGVRIAYDFNPKGEEGDFTATLQLSTVPGQTATVTLKAHVEAAADNDAQRLDEDGVAVPNSKGDLAAVLAAATNGQTVQLLRNVEGVSSVLSITKSITLDLNSHTISGSVNNMLTINGDGAIVTIMDSKSGGGISLTMNTATKIYAIDVKKGTLNIKNGNIECTNQSTSTASDSRAHGVRMEAGAIVNMTGGSVTSNSDGYMSNGFIVESTGTLDAVLTVSGGVITANGAVRTRGILGYGIINIKDGATVKATASSSNSYGVMISQSGGNGRLYMDGGVVSGEGATGSGVQTNNAACAFDIKGGSVSGGLNALNINNASTSGVVVHGGMFTGAIVHNNNKFLKGGYYTAQPAAAAIATNYLSYSTLEGTAIRDAGYLYGVGGSEEGAIVCKVIDNGLSTTTFYSSVSAALDYANQNNRTPTTDRNGNITNGITIIVTENCTLPKGYYTLPKIATLLVPYNADQIKIDAHPTRKYDEYTTPSCFKKLTFAEDAHLDIFGTIQTGGLQAAKGQTGGKNGTPTGAYGKIEMGSNSTMVIEASAQLYSWGYITGEGEIDVRRGAVVHEFVQITDWRGGTYTKNMRNNSNKVFPINQYHIQNIEVSTTYRPGSQLLCDGAVNAGGSAHSFDDVNLVGAVGSTSLFMMDNEDVSEDTWVRKKYNAETDQQVYEINSSAQLGSLVLQLYIYSFNSSNYVLPITNNMKIRLLTGEMQITQHTELLPGSVLEVDKEATMTMRSGKNLYVFDQTDWGTFTHKVPYSPSWKGGTNPRPAMTDAHINVHGTFRVDGGLYTTASGADIFSSNSDAGTIFFNIAAPTATTTVYVNNTTNASSMTGVTANPAWLKNGIADPAYATTINTSAHHSFCYMEDEWKELTASGCFVCDNSGVYYAKPHDYVALSSNAEDANHLYHSLDGTRTFILMDDCQWWEVKQTEEDDAVYYCADNDTYYYYNTTTNKWTEKAVTVTWKNFDGTAYATYNNVPFGGKPKYLGTNPTRPASAYYTYSFVGWLPEITEDTKVFENTTFIAQYEEKEIRYTVTFQDEAGKTIETQFVKVGEVPVCSFQPTKQGYYLYWKNIANNDPIAAVSQNVTYRAYYEEIPKTTFTIIFQNYNGTQLQKSTGVAEGTKPAYTGAAPTKDAIKDWTYEFAGWTPDIAPATEDMTYVAKYNAVPRKYTVTFKDAIEDNDKVTHMAADEVYQLGYGEVPVCQNPPVKESNAEFYYTVVWDKNIAAVTGDVTYTADHFEGHKNTLRLTASADANGSVAVAKDDVSQELSAIYDYGTELIVTATPNAHYQFKQWSDGNMDNPRSLTLTETKNIQAQFELEKMTITWKVDDQTIATSLVDYGTTPSYTGATPNKPSICGFYYTFAGWTPTVTAATAAQTYTAQFNKVANPSLIAYQVAFNGNGATSGSMPNQGFDAGVNQKLDANAYVNARTVTFNYNGNGQATTTELSAKAFQGWQDANDGSKTYTDGQVVNNLAPDCEHATITLNAQWSANYTAITLPAPTKTIAGKTFDGWFTAPTGGTKVGDKGDLYNPAADITLYAHWTEPRMENTTITSNVTLPAGTYKEDNVTIKITGSLTVPSSASLTVNTLILEATENSSGALIPANNGSNVNITNAAYFDFKFNASPMKWYAFAVPFEVESNNGVNAGEMEQDYDIIEYHGDVRATNGADRSAWDYIAKNSTLVPGKFYMILFARATTTVRFTKKSGSPLLNNSTPALYVSGNGLNDSWNGIANPTTFHAKVIPASVTEGQVYVSETGQYETKTLSAYSLTVGRPIFIQAKSTASVVVNTPSASAPARVMDGNSIDQFDLYISPAGAENSSDRLIVKASEDATGEYTIVDDLAKAGVSSKVAQMWTNAYGTRLCKQTALLINNNATYSLGLYAPTAGEYTLNVGDMPQDGSQLYLTYEEQPIWNLNMGEYTLPLSQGTNNGYGLQLVGPNHVATDVENAGDSAVNGNQKLILNNKLYIITNSGTVYDAQGKTVKKHGK